MLCKSEHVCRSTPLPPATTMKLDNCHTTTRHTPDTDCSLSHGSFFTHSIIVFFRRASHALHYFSVPATQRPSLCKRFSAVQMVLFSICPLKLRLRLTSCRCLQQFPLCADLATGYHLLALFICSKCCFVFPCKFVCLSGFGKLYCFRLGNVENCGVKKNSPQEDACNIACDGAFCGHLAC